MDAATAESSAGQWRARIERALARPPESDPQPVIDDSRRLARHRALHADDVRKAGVLVPIVGSAEPHIYFTERSMHLRNHPGQISFPGGRIEPDDANAQAAAIREAHEEVGLDPAHVRILGRLPDYVTGTGFDIAPFVAWLPPTAELTPDYREVARLFSVPLDYAMNAGHYRLETLVRNDQTFNFYAIDYEGNYIWGATAGMLHGLLERVAGVD